MDRHEAREARREQREPRPLLESDYLLGVHDAHRIGGLRFKSNHGFLLIPGKGWQLAPAYDINPVNSGEGLRLNIIGNENDLSLKLVREAAALYRIKKARREEIAIEVTSAVKRWRSVARKYGINKAEQDRMARAFRAVES